MLVFLQISIVRQFFFDVMLYRHLYDLCWTLEKQAISSSYTFHNSSFISRCYTQAMSSYYLFRPFSFTYKTAFYPETCSDRLRTHASIACCGWCGCHWFVNYRLYSNRIDILDPSNRSPKHTTQPPHTGTSPKPPCTSYASQTPCGRLHQGFDQLA